MQVMSWFFTRRSGIAEDRQGGTDSGTNAGVADRSAPVGMAITTAASRITAAEATAVGTDDRKEVTEGTGVRAVVNGILSTPPIPKTDSGSNAETRHITTEVGWSDIRNGGE